MASITKRNNTYTIFVSLGRDSSGKQIVKTTTYRPTSTTEKKIEKEVQDFARDFEKRVKNGEYFSGEKMSFEEVAQRWDKDWASNPENLTPSIREGYLEILQKRAYPHIGFMKISDIRPLHINVIYDEMKNEGKATATIKRTHCVINSVFKYAYRMELIKDNPCGRIELPKQRPNKDLHYFTLDEAKTFLEALTKEYTHKYKGSVRVLSSTGESYKVNDYEARHSIATQFQSYFYLALYGGFRRGEIIALTWEDIESHRLYHKIRCKDEEGSNHQIDKDRCRRESDKASETMLRGSRKLEEGREGALPLVGFILEGISRKRVREESYLYNRRRRENESRHTVSQV